MEVLVGGGTQVLEGCWVVDGACQTLVEGGAEMSSL